MNMKFKKNYLAFVCCLIPTGMLAQTIPEGEIGVSEVRLSPADDSIRVDMRFDLSALTLKSNRMIELFPTLMVDGEKVSLPSVKVMGRRQFISHQRNRSLDTWGEHLYWTQRMNGTRQMICYHTSVAAVKGTKLLSLYLDEDLCGCNRVVLANQKHKLTELSLSPKSFVPQLAYRQPAYETRKQRSESGSAYIGFPVNGTTILADYQQNRSELRKIETSIRKVINDVDVTINQISVKGYASPEGSFKSNERLAQLRTEAMVGFLVNDYQLDKQLFKAFSGAEDWEGLRNYLVDSHFDNKEAMLAIIDGEGTQDAREQQLRRRYPKQYSQLRDDCYPKLRHTDYVISYTVRAFNVEEAKKIIFEQPQKLSLQEMYAVAQTYEVGSPSYNEVFEIAVRMYPTDEAANLNAAVSALQRKDIPTAERHLQKAGDYPEATLARGVVAYYKKDNLTAERLFREAQKQGLSVATFNLKKLEEIMK